MIASTQHTQTHTHLFIHTHTHIRVHTCNILSHIGIQPSHILVNKVGDFKLLSSCFPDRLVGELDTPDEHGVLYMAVRTIYLCALIVVIPWLMYVRGVE